jgi:NAD(P)-dependent dehydrogenase (short-subunit alcohol dehydrogenase family)
MPQKNDARPVVLVSGANRGIGLAIARLLLAHGYRLSLGARDTATLNKAFGAENEGLTFNRFDALEPASAEHWVAETVRHFGRIDALVNNAGISDPVRIDEDNEVLLDLHWAINVKAPLRMTRLCLPYLEQTGRGRIVNISSLSGKRVRSPNVAYNMTKFALMGLTHTTRHVSWDKGVRATAICPSTVNTEMGARINVGENARIEPETLAELVRTVIELPNNAAIAELLVNIQREDMF